MRSDPVRPALSRRHFLLTAGATTAAVALAEPARALVRVDQHQIFTDAATAYDVPVAVLAAVSYAQTRWQDHDGRPSASLGYGPMHLVDGAAARTAGMRADKVSVGSLDTLGDAARLTGLSATRLREDPATNIRGAAALLAQRQRDAGRPTGTDTDPAQWYASVAAVSGLASADAMVRFGDSVMEAVREGASTKLADGSRLSTGSRKVGSPGSQRSKLKEHADKADRQWAKKAKKQRKGPPGQPAPIDAPRGLDVEWIPAPYEEFYDDEGDLNYGNHDQGFRPDAPKIRYIIIHDTEGQYPGVIKLVTDPTYVSWQYSLRSSDGHIAQHLRPEDVGWHAGNWYINATSIGLEHEGFAAQGAPWYSEAMYTTSAKLVRYLCEKYDIPRDRAHIIGHDQVPGVLTGNIPGMHWDPGPFWDWERYFELLGAPLDRGTTTQPIRAGDVVRILPGFAGNKQPLTGCDGAGDTCGDKDTNFVTLRVSPTHDADLVNDIGLHQKGQPATTEVSDISARATAGLEFVVAEVKGDWTAIWYLGLKAWFHNPRSAPTARKVKATRRLATARGAMMQPYGRCYPEVSAYDNPDDVQVVEPLLYEIPSGQQYVVTDDDPETAYYKAKTFDVDTPGDHINIEGKDQYFQISFGHRMAYLRAADVTVS